MVGKPDEGVLDRMLVAIRHRGPDDEGRYADETATLGHSRLSIIDVAGGHQPISNEDDSLHIVFNGEIYNYLDLRRELEAKGHRFKTATDTETILHLYEEMGERCPEKLRGMFAFAIWDSRSRRLFLARDRMGIKPLFTTWCGDTFLFGSELKAVLCHPAVEREIDRDALDDYLTLMYVPAPRTILRGVAKLQPGHSVTVCDGRETVRRYWELPTAEAATDSQDELIGDLRGRIRESVRRRLMSEVPLGAYLSGGLDSSLIVALMSEASERPVNTFSVGFAERGFDERPYSQAIAEEFKTAHRELVVRHDSLELLPRIIWHLDEPVADPAVIPTYLMAQLTKEHATVVLTGEGADELFAGYSHYKIFTWGDRLKRLMPTPLTRTLRVLVKRHAELYRILSYFSSIRDRARAYLELKAVFTEEEKTRLLAGGFDRNEDSSGLFDRTTGRDRRVC